MSQRESGLIKNLTEKGENQSDLNEYLQQAVDALQVSESLAHEEREARVDAERRCSDFETEVEELNSRVKMLQQIKSQRSTSPIRGAEKSHHFDRENFSPVKRSLEAENAFFLGETQP